MKTAVFLAVSRTGKVRISKKKPVLYPNEVCVLTVLEIPDKLFPYVPIKHTIKIADNVEIEPFETVDNTEIIGVPKDGII